MIAIRYYVGHPCYVGKKERTTCLIGSSNEQDAIGMLLGILIGEGLRPSCYVCIDKVQNEFGQIWQVQ